MVSKWREAYLKYQRNYAKKRAMEAKINKACRRCGVPAIKFQVLWGGKVIEESIGSFCLAHRQKSKRVED